VVRRGTTNPEGWRAAKIGGCCLGTALVHGGAENPAYGRQPSARGFARSPADSFKHHRTSFAPLELLALAKDSIETESHYP
jgi:hypothetical protein